MDPSGFDTLARSFAQTGTRRRVLASLLDAGRLKRMNKLTND